MNTIISLEGLSFYAFHGVHPIERLVGGQYIVDIAMTMHAPKNGFKDDLQNTIDYEKVYAEIAAIMKHPGNLIETIAEEITSKILETQPLVLKVSVDVSKMHPPVGGECTKSKISMKRKR